eukprot:scaffold644_cov357-Pavlova_lutheri.AAC.30
MRNSSRLEDEHGSRTSTWPKASVPPSPTQHEALPSPSFTSSDVSRSSTSLQIRRRSLRKPRMAAKTPPTCAKRATSALCASIWTRRTAPSDQKGRNKGRDSGLKGDG